MSHPLAELIPGDNVPTRYAEPDLVGIDRLGWNKAGDHFMLRAYRRGLVGCFLRRDSLGGRESPSWARRVAEYDHDHFRAEVESEPAQAKYCLQAGSGRGKRACFWGFAPRLDHRALRGRQNYPNCTPASLLWKGLTQMLGMLIAQGQQSAFEQYGTALCYADRGHRSGGMSLWRAAWSLANHGAQTRRLYRGQLREYDLRDEDDDEAAGHAWGRTGPPADLVELTKWYPYVKATAVEHPVDVDFVLDWHAAGGLLHTGSTLTGTSQGSPISRLTSIGAHAQMTAGFDDTDEFRDWYEKLTGRRAKEGVIHWGQTWGDWNTIEDRYWPPFWPPRAQGMWVTWISDAMRIIRSDCVAYLPEILGYQAKPIDFEALNLDA